MYMNASMREEGRFGKSKSGAGGVKSGALTAWRAMHYIQLKDMQLAESAGASTQINKLTLLHGWHRHSFEFVTRLNNENEWWIGKLRGKEGQFPGMLAPLKRLQTGAHKLIHVQETT